MTMPSTVVVGMSGGVDSSVSAYLLKQQGYRVIGLFMRNWDEQDAHGACAATQDYEDVVRVCDQLKIPHYSVSFAKEYWETVFQTVLRGFEAGHTPNPDTLCNREIKFKLLLDKAIELGGDFLATGHYCQIGLNNDKSQLLKGADPNKDQSYFLYSLSDKILPKVLFPVGNIPKSQVREIATQLQLATAQKKDSTGICFIGKRDFKPFLSKYISAQAGNFIDVEGRIIGRHDGIPYYTIGQRKGLGIGGPGDAWFVVSKDIARNAIILAQGEFHPALYRDELTATELNWISSEGLPQLPFACRAKIRYRQPDQDCVITAIDEGVAKVRFNTPQRAITPQQAIVFYDGNICLGGGIIQSSPES